MGCFSPLCKCKERSNKIFYMLCNKIHKGCFNNLAALTTNSERQSLLSSALALEVYLSTLPPSHSSTQRVRAPWKSCARQGGCSFSDPVPAAYGINKDIILEFSEKCLLENCGHDKWLSQQKGHTVSYTQSAYRPTRERVYLYSNCCLFPTHFSERKKKKEKE